MTEFLLKLIKGAIPVREAYFHSAINNADKTPENYFSDDSNVPSRRVQMWQTSDFLVFKQRNAQKEDVYFYTPNANVRFGFFKKDLTPEQQQMVEDFQKNKPKYYLK